jgi:hypothetical protein
LRAAAGPVIATIIGGDCFDQVAYSAEPGLADFEGAQPGKLWLPEHGARDTRRPGDAAGRDFHMMLGRAGPRSIDATRWTKEKAPAG